jgi:hypothetical protein
MQSAEWHQSNLAGSGSILVLKTVRGTAKTTSAREIPHLSFNVLMYSEYVTSSKRVTAIAHAESAKRRSAARRCGRPTSNWTLIAKRLSTLATLQSHHSNLGGNFVADCSEPL